MAAATEHLDTRASAAGLLDAVRERHDAATGAELDKFQLAVDWADMHPATSLDDAATVPGTQGEVAVAGPGAPLVAEFCVPEFALAINSSTDAGHRYLGDAVETHYRLPRLWARVIAGEVPVWKVAGSPKPTLSLPMAGAGFVDRHLAPIADKLSYAQLDRTVEEARTRFDPDAAEQRRRDAADGRHFDVHTEQVSYDGTIHIDAELDLADALDLDTAIAQVAEQLATLGCKETLDVRPRLFACGHGPTERLPSGRHPTTSWNMAPLCRRHHRLKTHSAWTYHRTGPGSFLWTSPLGISYPVDFTHLTDPFRRT